MSELGKVIGQHAPRDRYDDEGHSTGTYCTCGGWTGGYFADGEAGPFDDHLASVALLWLADITRGWAVECFDTLGPFNERGATLWDLTQWAVEQQDGKRSTSDRTAPVSDSQADDGSLEVGR